MGSENSKEAQKIQEFRNEYDLIRTEYDPRFKDVVIYRKKSDPSRMVITKEKMFKNQEELNEFIQGLTKRKNLYNDSVVKLIAVLGKKKNKIIFKIHKFNNSRYSLTNSKF